MPDGRESIPSYVTRCPKCGGHDSACVADPADKQCRRDAAKFMADWIRAGRNPELTTVGAVRAGAWCWCREKKPEQEELCLT